MSRRVEEENPRLSDSPALRLIKSPALRFTLFDSYFPGMALLFVIFLAQAQRAYVRVHLLDVAHALLQRAGFARLPRLDGGSGEARVEGWLDAGLAVEGVVLRVMRVGFDGRGLDVPRSHELELTAPPQDPDPVGAPPGARWFEGVVPGAERMENGYYHLEVEFVDGEGETLGSRRVGVIAIDRRVRLLPTLLVLVATLLLLVSPWSARWSARAAVGLALLQVFLVARAAV